MSHQSPEDNNDSHSPEGSATAAKLATPKTKNCPFCGDLFTSSSLGRHLDLYIKEKNPKAPDGVHDVDKIRQIRSNITRRQPRKNPQKTEHSTPASSGTYPPGASASAYGFVIGTDENQRIMINKPTWEATGVMTDIPHHGLRLDLSSRKQSSRSDNAMRKRMLDDRTRLRAAELALQEVLDSVNAASAHAHPPSPFDFDFLSQSFPALCLRMLPRQPTLSAAQIIENANHCPVGPPNETHHELLKKHLQRKLESFETKQKHAQERHDLMELFSPEDGGRDAQPLEQSEFSSFYNHLAQAFDVWKSTPDPQKATAWHLEVLRAHSSAHDEAIKLREELVKAEAQMSHLRLQIARLNECQQPKEYTFNIPTNHEIDPETVNFLSNAKADIPLDRESLIKKWATVVKDDRKYQRALPELDLADITFPEQMDVEEATPRQQDPDEDGPTRDPASLNGDDSEDAAGEVDDDMASVPNGVNGSAVQAKTKPVKVSAGTLDRGMLDPSLRNNDEDEDEDDMEVDRGDFGAELLLADVRARTKANK